MFAELKHRHQNDHRHYLCRLSREQKGTFPYRPDKLPQYGPDTGRTISLGRRRRTSSLPSHFGEASRTAWDEETSTPAANCNILWPVPMDWFRASAEPHLAAQLGPSRSHGRFFSSMIIILSLSCAACSCSSLVFRTASADRCAASFHFPCAVSSFAAAFSCSWA